MILTPRGSNTRRVTAPLGVSLSHEGASSRFEPPLPVSSSHSSWGLPPCRWLYLVPHIQRLQSYVFICVHSIGNMAGFSFCTPCLLLSFAAFLLASDSERTRGKLFCCWWGSTAFYSSPCCRCDYATCDVGAVFQIYHAWPFMQNGIFPMAQTSYLLFLWRSKFIV